MVFLNVRANQKDDDLGVGLGLVSQVPAVGDWFEYYHKQKQRTSYCGYVQRVEWQYSSEQCKYENRMYATIVVDGNAHEAAQ